jgi:integrase
MSRNDTGHFFKRADRGGRWYVRLRKDGHQRTAGGFDTKREARDALRALKKEMAEGPPITSSMTLAAYLTDIHVPYVEDRIAHSAIPSHLTALKRWGERLGAKQLRKITKADIQQGIRAMTGMAPSTRNRALAVISAAFREAVVLGLVRKNPCQGVQREPEKQHPLPAMSDEEQATLLAACPPRIRDAATLALQTGLRKTELERLEWRSVDLVNRVLTVREAKRGKTREVPITLRAAAVFERLRADRVVLLGRPDRVLPGFHLNGRLHRAWKEARTKAGYPDLRWHDLRHQWATNAVRRGVPLGTLMRLGGWATLAQVHRYAAHAATSELAHARDLLDGARDTAGGNRPRQVASL